VRPRTPTAERSPVQTSGARPVAAGLAAALAGAVLAGAVLAGAVLAGAVARGGAILEARGRILVFLGLWAAAWAVGVICARRLPARVAVPAVLLAAVPVRLAALSGPPTTSDDLYRYSWDGRVQAAGIDPYRYPPASPALDRLRERWLWPDDSTCARWHRPPGCTPINRPTARTIYPPLAQAWFGGVYRLAGIDARHKAWQVAGLVTDLAVVALLPLLLGAWGRDRRWVALYALSPFPALEFVNNGHVDGLAVVVVVAALLAAARHRPVTAGALLGAAALVKLYPALLVVALVGVGGRRLLALAQAAGAALVTVALGYLPHVVAVGGRVLGYLPDYLHEERYDAGGRYLLTGIVGLPAWAGGAVAAAAVAAAVAWVVVRRPAVPRGAAVLLGAALLAATPVQPWYAVTLLAVATIAAEPAWAVVAAAGYPYYFAVILDAPHAVALGRVGYGVALLAVAAASCRRLARSAAIVTGEQPSVAE
jgi:hypothetical protein